MLFKSKYYAIINNNLTIVFVSDPLAELLNYQKNNELKGNQKANLSYEGTISNSENFQHELFAMLSNYLEYGKSNQ